MPPSQGLAAPAPPQTAREALYARLRAIEARHRPGNPVAADEARRLGERAADDERLPSDPSLTHDEALANVLAGFPDHQAETRLRTDDGRWLNPQTGVVSD